MLRTILIAVVLLALATAGYVFAAGKGWLGDHEAAGRVATAPRPDRMVAAREVDVANAAAELGVSHPKQILFGDLHVHTTFSFDAFLISLPIVGGEGAHPPADACDFARFCSALDFWSVNDHAEGITPAHWSETIDSIRQCNDVAGSSDNPDTVAFLGWEWTQVGTTPADHYGHKNVVLHGTDDDQIPARPIAAGGRALQARRSGPGPFVRGLLAVGAGGGRMYDFATYMAERDDLETCDADTPSPDLPAGCFEVAETPDVLYRKLDEWGDDSIVIPHGTTWGFYTPPGSEWKKQLVGDMYAPDRQRLIEVYSGHGDSEPYRPWRAVDFDEAGNPSCPEPTANYLPTCWRAGEIIRARCLDDGEDQDECEARAVEARANAAAAGAAAHLTVPGAKAAEWLDAGQCRDCDQPAFNYRPGSSAQYILAVRNFDDPAAPRGFRMGFMASSDNHFARPGTGFKEVNRRGFTESANRRGQDGADSLATRAFLPPAVEPQSRSVAFDPADTKLKGFQLVELERQASFFLTGGLIATHAEGRDRDSIWQAWQRREVYGTTGPRILLWFDLLNPPGSRGRTAPMGSELTMGQNPIFQVRAVGSFEQKPGCPDYATQSLGPKRLEQVCKGECYNPSDQRRLITRIEVVRVRPQSHPDEPIEDLIDDPWRTYRCEPDPAGCSVLFEDPDYAGLGRDSTYYVRAYEAPAPGINAENLRCERDETGQCVSVQLCGSSPDDDCLGQQEPRAWSSPIWIDFPDA